MYLYIIVNEFGILTKPNKMCLHKSYSEVHKGKDLSGALPIQNSPKMRPYLSQILFKCASEYIISMVKENQQWNWKEQVSLFVNAYAAKMEVVCSSECLYRLTRPHSITTQFTTICKQEAYLSEISIFNQLNYKLQ